MKTLKGFLALLCLILIVCLLVLVPLGIYYYVTGGEPEIENFDQLEHSLEMVAEAVQDYSADSETRVTIFLEKNALKTYDGDYLPLTEEQRQAVEKISGRFDCLWVSSDYVIFWRDERKSYGLLYADSPLSVISDMKDDWYSGMEYHRINGDWYEIGNWGI